MSVRSLPDWVPDENRTLGWAVLEWSANYLSQPDGPLAGQPWEFTAEQVRVLLRWYAVDDAGRFLYRRGVLRRMKGWGKSPFLASLAAVELCGPCRFGGWKHDGTPRVVPHGAPWVQIAATNQDQTRNTMTVFPGLFSNAAIREYDIDLGKTIIYSRKGAGRIEAVTSSARGLEGGRPSLMIADETQHWLPSNEGPAMMAVAQRNLAKSRDGSARMIEITNAHLVDEGSVAEATYEAWRQADGHLDGVYYDATEAAPLLDDAGQHVPIAEWSDAQLRDGLLAARGDSTWLDVDRILAEIRDPTTSESHARRFYLNQVWASANEEWLPVGAWAGREEKHPIPDGSRVILAVDGSYNDDSTGIVVASLTEPVHLDVVNVWEPDPTARDAEVRTVPIEDVEDAIRAACKKWRVREVNFDPYRWARTMQALAREGLPVVEFPNSPERMIAATQRFQTAVVNATVTQSGDARLARHIGNAVVRENSRGKRIVKETKWSPRKIDLAVAAVMAHDRAAGRPSSGAGWLEYMRQQIQQSSPEEASVAPAQPTPAPDAAARPRDFLLGPDGPTPTPPTACRHRWFSDGRCVFCHVERGS